MNDVGVEAGVENGNSLLQQSFQSALTCDKSKNAATYVQVFCDHSVFKNEPLDSNDVEYKGRRKSCSLYQPVYDVGNAVNALNNLKSRTTETVKDANVHDEHREHVCSSIPQVISSFTSDSLFSKVCGSALTNSDFTGISHTAKMTAMHSRNLQNPLSLQRMKSEGFTSTRSSEVDAKPPKRLAAKRNDNRPPFSYMQLIKKALNSSPDGRMSLKEIYAWIEKNFPYYKTCKSGWKNSIRHNLSLYDVFERESPLFPYSVSGPSLWKLNQELIAEQERKTRLAEAFLTRGKNPLILPTVPANKLPVNFVPIPLIDADLAAMTDNKRLLLPKPSSGTLPVLDISCISTVAPAYSTMSTMPSTQAVTKRTMQSLGKQKNIHCLEALSNFKCERGNEGNRDVTGNYSNHAELQSTKPEDLIQKRPRKQTTTSKMVKRVATRPKILRSKKRLKVEEDANLLNSNDNVITGLLSIPDSPSLHSDPLLGESMLSFLENGFLSPERKSSTSTSCPIGSVAHCTLQVSSPLADKKVAVPLKPSLGLSWGSPIQSILGSQTDSGFFSDENLPPTPNQRRVSGYCATPSKNGKCSPVKQTTIGSLRDFGLAGLTPLKPDDQLNTSLTLNISGNQSFSEVLLDMNLSAVAPRGEA